MSSNDSQSSIVVDDPNEFDVLLGRGNNVNHRPGNVLFRKMAAEKSTEYTASAKKEHKDAIAQQLIGEIIDRGGRFLRPITAANSKGEHVAAWEVVTGEVVSTKAKQAMRDAAASARKPQRDSSQLHLAGAIGVNQFQRDPMLGMWNFIGDGISGASPVAESLASFPAHGIDRIQGLGESHFPMGSAQLPNFHSNSAQAELVQLVQRQRMLDAFAMQAGYGGQNLGSAGMGSLHSVQSASLAARLPGNFNLGNSAPAVSGPGLPNWLHPQLAQQSAFADHVAAGQFQQHLPVGDPILSRGIEQNQFPARLEDAEYQPLDRYVNAASLRKRLRSHGDVEDTYQQSAQKRSAHDASGVPGPTIVSSGDRKMPASAAGSSDESDGSTTTVSSLLRLR